MDYPMVSKLSSEKGKLGRDHLLPNNSWVAAGINRRQPSSRSSRAGDCLERAQRGGQAGATQCRPLITRRKTMASFPASCPLPGQLLLPRRLICPHHDCGANQQNNKAIRQSYKKYVSTILFSPFFFPSKGSHQVRAPS